MKRAAAVAVSVAGAVAMTTIVLAQQKAPQNESITQDKLRADLFFVAGDAMRGRLTDTDENRATADYIRSRFERLGLKPAAPGNSYFQNYNLMTPTLGADNALDIVASDERSSRHVASGQDFYPQRFSASGHAKGDVVFVGSGIKSPKLQWDDYRSGSSVIGGKIAMILDHEPGERDANSPFDGVVTSEFSTPWRKVVAAQEAGARAVLFVTDTQNHPGPSNFDQTARNFWPAQPPRIKPYTLVTWADRVHIPVAQISPAVGDEIAQASGKSLADLAKAAESAKGGITAVTLDMSRLDLHVAVDRHVVPDRNVVALLEGSDARLKNEWVIVSAHFDHDGADATQILNGADDNGSGTVALLEIAEAYAAAAKEGHRPKRSVLFAAWNSEERGLLGAWAYTEQPLAPLNTVAAVLNMDMVGRNEEVPVGGGPRFNGLEVQNAESNATVGLELKKRYDNNSSQLVRRSDQWPFLQSGVPALGFMTGLHPDYHTRYDRPEKINYVKLEKVARLIHQASWDIANADTRPKS